MKVILYILLGLSLGSGMALIVLQERFLRERRRLMALAELQRAKASQALEEANKTWELRCQQLTDEVQGYAAKAVEEEAPAPPALPDMTEFIPREAHERLLQEKDAELSQLMAENSALAERAINLQAETADLQGQLTYLHGEVARLDREIRATKDDDFILLAQPGGHLLPGSVVRAFIKGAKNKGRAPINNPLPANE